LPLIIQALFLDGRSGLEREQYRFNGKAGDQGIAVLLSDDGTYAAMLTGNGPVVRGCSIIAFTMVAILKHPGRPNKNAISA
jgi:hypothetical protein